MNILLTAINAKYIHSNLAVYSLRACAGEYRDAVELAEYTINNQKDYILEELYKRKPDVLCFSCYIWNIDYVTDIAREYKKLCPSVPIWVGGPEVSYEVEAFLRENPYIDGVMIGEGEDTFRELCGYYAHKRKLSDIAGIAFRKNSTGNSTSVNNIGGNKAGEIVFTSPRPIKNMSEIPFCYDTLDDFQTASSTTRAAGDARFRAATVCHRWIRHCVLGIPRLSKESLSFHRPEGASD